MTDRPIIVEGLGKRYRIRQLEARPRTLGGTVASAVATPFRYLLEMARPPREDEILWALRDVSFEVKRGEVLGIIGHNGAGKSTLLKILSRITDPTEGRAIITGRVGSLLEVGTGFNQELTGRENIYLSGTILGMKRAEIDRKFDEIVAFAGVEQFLDTPIKRYSSGMNVRLGFAVAAHLEPEVLIVDEVLSVGDAAFQRKSLGKMENIAGEGRTILFVSHSMPAVQAFCHRVIMMANGRVAHDGPPDTVTSQYLNLGADLQAEGDVDLETHANRVTALGEQRLTRFRILNAAGQVTTAFQMGERVTFELHLDLNTSVMPDPVIVFAVEKRGIEVCNLSTRYMVKEPVRLTRRVVARCVWELGTLAPGIYNVADIILKSQAGTQRLDAIEDVTSFEILPRDVYGTGRLPLDSKLLAPAGQWEFETVSETAHARLNGQ